MSIDFVFQIAILIMSVVVHEVAHGFAANSLGDLTAKYQGRLTLNPIKHLDMVGSIIVPVLSYMTGGFIFGWAKPVPYNPHNLRSGRYSEVIVALAGPFVNFVLAIIFGILLRAGLNQGYSTAFLHITGLIVYLNVLLGVFNLVPIPPLDGSKVLFSVFPAWAYKMRGFFERSGFILVILFILFLWPVVSPLVSLIFSLITGVTP